MTPDAAPRTGSKRPHHQEGRGSSRMGGRRAGWGLRFAAAVCDSGTNAESDLCRIVMRAVMSSPPWRGRSIRTCGADPHGHGIAG